MSKSDPNCEQPKIDVPSVERIQWELSSAISIDGFLGKDAIFGRLFSMTLDLLLEAGQTAKPGYEEYEARVGMRATTGMGVTRKPDRVFLRYRQNSLCWV